MQYSDLHANHRLNDNWDQLPHDPRKSVTPLSTMVNSEPLPWKEATSSIEFYVTRQVLVYAQGSTQQMILLTIS